MSIRIDGRCYAIRIGSIMYCYEHTDARHSMIALAEGRGYKEEAASSRTYQGGEVYRGPETCVCEELRGPAGGLSQVSGVLCSGQTLRYVSKLDSSRRSFLIESGVLQHSLSGE